MLKQNFNLVFIMSQISRGGTCQKFPVTNRAEPEGQIMLKSFN